MKFCTQCGAQLTDDQKFCSQCGAEQTVPEVTDQSDEQFQPENSTTEKTEEIKTSVDNVPVEEKEAESPAENSEGKTEAGPSEANSKGAPVFSNSSEEVMKKSNKVMAIVCGVIGVGILAAIVFGVMSILSPAYKKPVKQLEKTIQSGKEKNFSDYIPEYKKDYEEEIEDYLDDQDIEEYMVNHIIEEITQGDDAYEFEDLEDASIEIKESQRLDEDSLDGLEDSVEDILKGDIEDAYYLYCKVTLDNDDKKTFNTVMLVGKQDKTWKLLEIDSVDKAKESSEDEKDD